ncbi:hypothetical protein F383_16276 [Gossypium arboreum]|uniref:Uncharacterized protein n=1 Tax=Gossypium arboreum TaxID=29729 RepID=A0A0B0NCY0_GOSAR|nr:hypothetical protein F383_16276 [Gossypium arboreum]
MLISSIPKMTVDSVMQTPTISNPS